MNVQSKRPARRLSIVLIVVLVAATGVAALEHAGAPGRAASTVRVPAAADAAPASAGFPTRDLAFFEPNLGQADAAVAFLTRSGGDTLFLTPTDAVRVFPPPTRAASDGSGRDLSETPGFDARGLPVAVEIPDSPGVALRTTFVDAAHDVRLVGEEQKGGLSNYLVGSDASSWVRGVPHFGAVRYIGLYDGIDLRFYRNAGGLVEYDFLLAPGADPAAIKLAFSGATATTIDGDGNLVFETHAGRLLQPAPVLHQRFAHGPVPVAGAYELSGGIATFRIGPYDPTRELVIDPVIAYATYLGGSGDDWAMDVAVDSRGAPCITGFTENVDFPAPSGTPTTTLGAPNLTIRGHVFVARLTPAGDAYEYLTYVGGDGISYSYGGLDSDSAGRCAVVGTTSAKNFPVHNAAQPAHAGGHASDGFAFKLNAAGDAFEFSTYLGGTASESSGGIAIDASGSTYVVGSTASADFPVKDAYQATLVNSSEIFLVRLDPGGAMDYSTFLGGTLWEYASGVAADADGRAHVTGITGSLDFPTLNAAQPALAAGYRDAFAVRFAPDGASLEYATYVGGAGGEWGSGGALAPDGTFYVSGMTQASDYPLVDATSPSGGGAGDAYLSAFAPSGSLVFSTTLGGPSYQSGDVGVGPDGSVFVDAFDLDSNPPRVRPIRSTVWGADHWLVDLSADRRSIEFSTFLGGVDRETGASVAVDGAGNMYVVGGTSSKHALADDGVQPRPGELMGPFTIVQEAFLVKVSPGPSPPSEPVDVVMEDGDEQREARIRWSAPFYSGDGPITAYHIHRGLDPRNLTFYAAVGPEVRVYDDPAAWDGTDVAGSAVPIFEEPPKYYNVRAVNAVGAGIPGIGWCFQQMGFAGFVLGESDCYPEG